LEFPAAPFVLRAGRLRAWDPGRAGARQTAARAPPARDVPRRREPERQVDDRGGDRGRVGLRSRGREQGHALRRACLPLPTVGTAWPRARAS